MDVLHLFECPSQYCIIDPSAYPSENFRFSERTYRAAGQAKWQSLEIEVRILPTQLRSQAGRRMCLIGAQTTLATILYS